MLARLRGNRLAVGVVVTLGNCIIYFFFTALSIIIPLISRELDCSVESAAWITIAPGFVSCMLVPAVGKLAEFAGGQDERSAVLCGV